MSVTTYVLYHANCYDGFGAAYAAWRALGDNAEYLAVTHGQDFPAQVPVGADVFIVDFSYPRADLIEHKRMSKSLTVLDHHVTAQSDLDGLDFATFDMQKSGARLAWEYWHPLKKLPRLLAYVEDRDLWRFNLPKSREVSAALRLHPMDFWHWDKLAREAQHYIPLLKREGETALALTNQTVKMMCDKARTGNVGGHDVPVVNATAYWSEVGEELLSRFPLAPFVGSYYDATDGRRTWSLRSRQDFDVSAIAKALGGGGHRQAAGFVERAA